MYKKERVSVESPVHRWPSQPTGHYFNYLLGEFMGQIKGGSLRHTPLREALESNRRLS